MMQDLFIGVDVAKDWLDIHHPNKKPDRITNTPTAIGQFTATCRRDGAWDIFEATCGYDHALRNALERSGTKLSRINPRQARDFARAMGIAGKTGRIDARMLAEFGVRLRPKQMLPVAPQRRALQEIITLRRQLVKRRKQEGTRLKQTQGRVARADIRSLVAVLYRRICKVENQIADLIAKDEELSEAARGLQTVPGGRIAALVGLAPVARDSGQMKGRRMISGERSTVRTLLHIAALHASRFSETFGTFRRRLAEAGKPIEVVLIAKAHKLLSVLNAMVANKQDFRFDPSGKNTIATRNGRLHS